MSTEHSQPNELERAVVARIARDEPWLEGAPASLQVVGREYTGVGGYTYFACDTAESDSDPSPGLKPLIRVPAVPNGMGAVLWCRGARPQCLELFTYGDDRWDGKFQGFSFDEDNKA